MRAPIDYSIAVATVNGPVRLEQFLFSVVENTVGFNYVIAICDDCSNEDLAKQNYALAVKYKCLYTRNKERKGVPYSWNRAIELAEAKQYIVANDDIRVCRGWLHAYDTFRKANSHLKLGVVAWPATNIGEDVVNINNFTVSIDVSHVTNPIVACAGYLFGFTKEMYADVGRFDERYFATWEEIDFGAKLCMNGYKSIGLNRPVIFHEGGASFSDPINQHPAMRKQSMSQKQWVEKWSSILNIQKKNKTDQELIKEISDALVAKIPKYQLSDFNLAEVNI